MKDERFDLEDELRAGRSQPRDEFVAALAGDVRGRVRRSRIGLTMALSGLVIVAVASFGGIGYAASDQPSVDLHKNNSSASAQYGAPQTLTPPPTTTSSNETPPPPNNETPPPPNQEASESPVVTTAPTNTVQTPKEAVKSEAAAAAPAATPKPAPVSTSSQLPFTGLALWIPLAIGLLLIAAGVVLRTRAKRHGSGAH
ncbi:MAG TPA: hypothetical protein VH816_10370 [Gaiellaceae bacterium]